MSAKWCADRARLRVTFLGPKPSQHTNIEGVRLVLFWSAVHPGLVIMLATVWRNYKYSRPYSEILS